MSRPAKSKKIKMIRITLLRTGIGKPERQKATIRALGLHRVNQTVDKLDNPCLRGMLAKVSHLVKIEEQVE